MGETTKPTFHKWIKDDRYGLPICEYCGIVLRRDNHNLKSECRCRARVELRRQEWSDR